MKRFPPVRIDTLRVIMELNGFSWLPPFDDQRYCVQVTLRMPPAVVLKSEANLHGNEFDACPAWSAGAIAWGVSANGGRFGFVIPC